MRELSEAAKVAKLIRTELKKHGIKAKVRSSNFSMGNSVDVTVYDQLPAAMDEINSFCNEYQEGNFNGMEDIYEYSNTNKDIPQAKYVFVANKISDSLRQKAWDFIRGYYAEAEDAPEDVNEAIHFPMHGLYGDMIINRVLGEDGAFWTDLKPRIRA